MLLDQELPPVPSPDLRNRRRRRPQHLSRSGELVRQPVCPLAHGTPPPPAAGTVARPGAGKLRWGPPRRPGASRQRIETAFAPPAPRAQSRYRADADARLDIAGRPAEPVRYGYRDGSVILPARQRETGYRKGQHAPRDTSAPRRTADTAAPCRTRGTGGNRRIRAGAQI